MLLVVVVCLARGARFRMEWQLCLLKTISNGAIRSRADRVGVCCQHPAAVARWRWIPFGEASLYFRFWDFQSNFIADRVDRDLVAVFDNSKWTAIHCLWGDMPDHKAMAATGKSAVGDQCYFFAEATAHDGGSGGKHLPHARPASWAFVTDHQDLADLHRAIQNVIHRFFF